MEISEVKELKFQLNCVPDYVQLGLLITLISSTTKGFRRTGISLLQFQTKNSMDTHRNLTLPDSYTIVPAVALKSASVLVN